MTLLDAIVEHAPKVKDAGGEENRPGIVHRLDKGVSGVMIVAKTPKAFEHLKTQFKDRLADKHYQALVYGVLSHDHDTIDLPISRSKNLGRMVARAKGEEGKDAVTEYDVLKRFKMATHVRVHPKTGRTHQIRVHFKAIDHPVVGDTLYVKRTMRHIRPIKMDRVFLHAESLTIALPSGETKTFSAPLPEPLEEMLKKLPTV
jgi:23S rRNA pseudouridine1911/1915/1917 synthase